MTKRLAKSHAAEATRQKLLDAALKLIRQQGYTATTVDHLCAEAGVTKGAFFHHFDNKEALGVAAADHWLRGTGAMFAAADYHRHADPLDRVLAYLDLRRDLARGELADISCLAGTMVQEMYRASPAIRAACEAAIFGHADTLEPDFAEAIRVHGADPAITAASLAAHTQVVLQGGFVLAKARNDPALVADSIGHLRRYLMCIFRRAEAA